MYKNSLTDSGVKDNKSINWRKKTKVFLSRMFYAFLKCCINKIKTNIAIKLVQLQGALSLKQ